MVIFGASGDLTRRKLLPALYNLLLDGLLPRPLAVVGASRRALADEEFAAAMQAGVERHSRRGLDPERWNELGPAISFCTVEEGNPESYRTLAGHLESVENEHGLPGNRLFYLATPPSAFPGIVEGLGRAGLQRPGREGAWSRIVLEKPIGHDESSARELNRLVNGVFPEQDVYRIDHYLGKETVQNLMVFRFGNAIFEPLWNQKYVDHVQITVAESLGVEGRGAYFEEAGITQDMLQNHMFQLLCLIAMEAPASLRAEAIRDEKVKVLQALRPVEPDQVGQVTVRGQYARGVIDGKEVAGYRDEKGVAPDSRTETYVATKLQIDNWRWAGVPFYLRAGKRLNRRLTEIVLQFRDVPHRLFHGGPPAPNSLGLRIQPDEGICLRFDAKSPGAQSRIQPVAMDFSYGETFGQQPPEAYERLLLDALLGDSTLFLRRDEIEGAWAWVDRLIEGWAREDAAAPLPEYTAGTWGPAEAHVMLARDGRTWRRPQ